VVRIDGAVSFKPGIQLRGRQVGKGAYFCNADFLDLFVRAFTDSREVIFQGLDQ
jgi:hypothetical protein